MMMSELFKITLSLSLSGAAMILIVLLFGKLFRNRISSNWRYYIWLLVVLRLLVPYSPEISVLGTLFQGEAGRSIVESAPVSQAETPAKPDTVLSVPANPVPDPVPNPAPTDRDVQERPMPAERNNVITILQTLISWLWLTWLVVALILFIRKITMYQSFAKYVRAGQTDVTDETLLMEFGEICGQAGVKRAIELRINNLIASPLLLGIFRPCVILPTTAMPREDRRYIYLHELTHYKRGDIFYKWLLQLALCLHWFNPLVYLMVREANQACELSCDASVIRSMDTEERRGYGDALLKSLESPGSYRESLAAVTLHENSVLLKERLESIKNYTKNNKWRAVVSAILCLVIFAGGFALGAYLPNMTVISEANGGELTPEGLPIMSASNRNVYDKYVGNIYITGLLRRNFSPEDISELVAHGGTSLLTLANALKREEFEKNDWFDGAVPADFADTVLSTYFPLSKDKIREVCADIYDAQTNTYSYIGGLGGGPALPIVTGFNQNGKLLTIQYTWYVGDPAADEFRYASDDSGELLVELSGDTFRYLSNKVIETLDTETAANPEGYNIREKSEYTYYARTLMKQAHPVFSWYYNETPYDTLWIAPDAPELALDGSYYKEVVRFKSLDELIAATETVFTKEFCEANFYPMLDIGKFREIDGLLYIGDQGGIDEGATTPPKEYILRSVEDDRVVLTAICERFDPNADNPSNVPLIDYTSSWCCARL